MNRKRNKLSLSTVLLAAGAMGAEVAAQDFVLTGQQFDSWITGRGGQSPIAQLSGTLEMRIDAVDRIAKLSSAQREKLTLAGRGDAIRYKDAYDQMRAQLVDMKYDRQKKGEIHHKIQPLRTRFQEGILGPSSLFGKVMRRTLDSEQLAAYDADRAQRRAFRYEAKLRLNIAIIEKAVPMTETQRQALLDWLLAETKPPRTSGQAQLESFYAMYQLSKTPQEMRQTIFDDAQLRVLNKMLQNGAGYEQHLRKNGFLPEREADEQEP